MTEDPKNPRNHTGMRLFFFLLGLFVMYASINALFGPADWRWLGWAGIAASLFDLWVSNPLKTSH